MSKRWVVVTDNVKTRIYSVAHDDGILHPVVTLAHPEGHEKSQDIEADRPGRAYDIVGHGRHGVGTAVDPVEQVRIRYAKRIVEYLRSACQADRCNRLLLVAGPHLLGLIRKHLDLPPGVSVTELEKNLGPFDDHEVQEHLRGQT
jgi:protein required for attachment to host cells